MQFEKTRMVRYQSVVNNKKIRKIKNINEVTLHNFYEWLKFQQYAKKHL